MRRDLLLAVVDQIVQPRLKIPMDDYQWLRGFRKMFPDPEVAFLTHPDLYYMHAKILRRTLVEGAD